MFDAFPDNPDDPAADGESALRASLERVLASRRFDLMDVQKYDIARPDGTFEERWWKPANSPVVDVNGNVVAIIHHVADVTAEHDAVEALRHSERHSETLLAELQHRVRNSLAVVRSIARRTAENSGDVDDMLAHFQGRLDAFSRVQAALSRNPDARIDIASLVEDELTAHAARDGRQVRIKGSSVMLTAKTAERLSLALHELATHAVKHGALMNGDGKIAVTWQCKRANGSELLTFRWEESGVEIDPTAERREGFGMELLQRSLPYDLEAETEVELRPQGLAFELRMKLPKS
jgi:two-component system CheB/CheR fusion protein